MYVVIMAGGIGARFWPKSRRHHPKQLLTIVGKHTLIQNTIARLDSIVNPDNLFIITTQPQVDEIKRQLPSITDHNLIIEPKGKNTAPCIGLAAIFIKQIDPDAVMLVLPSDHFIKNKKDFRNVLITAEKVAERENSLVTIGIQPTYPSTGYGYIQYDEQIDEVNQLPIYKVKTFAEKPDLLTAERFIESGDFLWNSGMFLWKAKVILKEIEESIPELYDGLMEIEKYLGTESQDEAINRVYCQIKRISIDYGVMEHAKNVSVLKGNFGWSDVGTWEEVHKLMDKDVHENASSGPHIFKDTNRCLIDVPDKFVATIGVDDLIVVDSGDALLICKKDVVQSVKELVDLMKRKELDQYL